MVEGFPFPSGDAWSFVGDPVEMPEELARLEVANRWPGVDPDALLVELPTDFAGAAEDRPGDELQPPDQNGGEAVAQAPTAKSGAG